MKTFIAVFLFLLCTPLWSQESDTAAVQDSIPIHSVRKATILSAVVPGAGQIYNHTAMRKGKKKAFWKVPLIYAGLGGLGYLVVNNHSNVLQLRDQYRTIEAGGVATGEWSVYGSDLSAILSLHDQYARWRDLSILGFALGYTIQVVDAAVEAHFVNFDVTEDLSMRITPTLLNMNTAGIKLSFNFR